MAAKLLVISKYISEWKIKKKHTTKLKRLKLFH